MANPGSSVSPGRTDMTGRSPSVSSSSQALVSPSGGEEKERPRLTDLEKKANHIASEQKRRQAIREGFDRLSEIVPGLQGQARSEGIVLHATLLHLRKLLKERQTLIELLEAGGAHVDASMKKPLEMLPPGWLDQESAESESDSSSAEESSSGEDSEQSEGEGEGAEKSSGTTESSKGDRGAD